MAHEAQCRGYFRHDYIRSLSQLSSSPSKRTFHPSRSHRRRTFSGQPPRRLLPILLTVAPRPAAAPARAAGLDAAGAGRRTLRRRPRPLRLLLPPPQAFLASPALILLLNPSLPTQLITTSPPHILPSLLALARLCIAANQCAADFSITRVLLRTGSAGPSVYLSTTELIPLSSVASDFMGDLASERVPMEGHNISFICEDDPGLLGEALPPAGQTLCSCGELHHSQDGTHEQCMNGDSVETEVDISGSPSSGIKRDKGSGGNSQPTLRLVSAMKGGRERSGEASPTEVRRVKWAPDVYDPPVTSVDHSVKSHQQRPRSRKKEKNKQKHKKKRKSRGKNSGLHDAVRNPPALQDPGPSSPGDFGELEPEVLDYDTGGGGQEPECRSDFAHEMLDEATSSRQDSSYSPKTSFPAAEAS